MRIASSVCLILLTVCGLALGVGSPRAEEPGREGRQGAFSWKQEKDPATGWTIWQLSYDDPADPRRSQSIKICPEGGSNLFSFILGNTELLRVPAELKTLQRRGAGILVLYPTPNRVRDGKFQFEGREFKFSDDGQMTIHGLALSRPWNSEAPEFQSADGATSGVAVRTWMDFEPGLSQYERFPIRHRLTLRYSLTVKGVRADVRIENHDSVRLPFGFALHPYFNLLGAREETFLQVPAEKKMEATSDLLPTGKLLPLDGASFDLRQPRRLSELALDDVFLGMSSAKTAGYEARDVGIALELQASDDFTHVVVYTPKDRPFFCIENQTCSTDAHNLYARGLREESHLLVIEPGAVWTGWVELRPRWK